MATQAELQAEIMDQLRIIKSELDVMKEQLDRIEESIGTTPPEDGGADAEPETAAHKKGGKHA